MSDDSTDAGDLLDQMSDAVVAIDGDGNICLFNRAAETLFGWDADEVIGHPVELLVPESMAGRHPQLVSGFMTSGEGRRLMAPDRDRIPARRKDGTTFPAAITVGPIDLGGRRVGMAVVRDQTRMVMAEAALQRHVEELAQRVRELEASDRHIRQVTAEAQAAARRADDILEQVSDALVAVDAGGHVVVFNRAAEELFGYSADEMKGRPVELLVPESVAAHHPELVARFIASGAQRRLMAPNRELIPARRKDGTTFLAAITVGPIDLGTGGTLGMAVVRDQTARAKAERALELRNEELEHFMFIAAHDLKEPLRKIEAFGQELERSAPDLDGWARTSLDRMTGAAKRMAAQLRELEQYTRAASSDMELTVCDLNAAIADAVEDLQLRMTESGGEVHIAADLPPVVGDHIRLRQVFQNLIGNGLKFTRPNLPPVVTVSARRTAGGDVEVSVHDNGIGIEPEFAERVFEPFRRVHGSEDYEGTGMGLTIAKKVVEMMGGSIEVERTDGPGTTMVVALMAAGE